MEELHKLQPHRWHDPMERAEQLRFRRDARIMSGAGMRYDNFKHFVLANEGIVIFLDAYKVGSYAEGALRGLCSFSLLASVFARKNIERPSPVAKGASNNLILETCL